MSADRRVVGIVLARTQGMTLGGRTLVEIAREVLATVADPVRAAGESNDPSRERLWAEADVVVVHDPLCPLIPSQVLSRCIDVVRPGVTAVGIRPVTDTVKEVEGGVLHSTLDRDRLAELASPVAFAASDAPTLVRAAVTPEALDLLSLVRELGRTCRLVPVEVPPAGRRIDSPDDLVLLGVEQHVSGRRPVTRPAPGPRGT